ncbi:aldo/keto reductase [Roseomonas marmotae]|uniref:Aldo/keto reductase n=1 Tax=Roseomonas marmotae TaxID=2768161 RepID=A0ABS3KFR8_9PROT|nr:aldo/keto reductase [Roseomonas marmotae]MBO1076318.1 aldo/keto reductase [Roseomonas marmotae]QTI80557.1 aldo/keto reductase [Roseomonas marmotae]
MHSITLADGTPIPTLGQGTWRLGERGADRGAEAAVLRLGLDLGLTLIDTAEMYGDGGAEEVVGEAIAGRREEVFLVSKAYPQNASRTQLPLACERSLRRMGTDVIDLYLLHWRGAVPLAETAEAMERLKEQGKIRHWGVSNLDVADLEELGPHLKNCAANQVLYNLEARGVEFDLLPFCQNELMPVMAYSPLGQGGALLRHPVIRRVAERQGATPAQVALAWTLRNPGVISIPKASNEAHLRENLGARLMVLTPEDLLELDSAFPPPRHKRSLEMI